MPAKRLFVPDDIIRPARPGENTNIRLLQYVNSTTQENFDAFLTHYAMVYILSGVKQIKVSQSKFQIQPGELFLIPRGEYVMSEYITGENGFQSLMLFFSKKVAQDLIEQISGYLSAHMSDVVPMKKEAVKIIPHNPDVERIFSTIATYSKGASNFTCELLKLKFAELIYLLLDSPYQKLILSFLLDAATNWRYYPAEVCQVSNENLFFNTENRPGVGYGRRNWNVPLICSKHLTRPSKR